MHRIIMIHKGYTCGEYPVSEAGHMCSFWLWNRNRHETKLGSSGLGDTLNTIFVISVGIFHHEPF